MLRAMLSALSLSVLLIVGGCEYNLAPSATAPEVHFDRLVQEAEAVYGTSYTEFESRAVREKSDVMEDFQHSVMRYRTSKDAAEGISFSALDVHARSLIRQHRDDIPGRYLVQGISRLMLSTALRYTAPDGRLPADARMSAVRYYLELEIYNQGTAFESQIRALQTLSEWDPPAAEQLALHAFANQQALKRVLQQPPSLSKWIRDQASDKQIQALHQRQERSRKGRLQRFEEARVGQQLATLAGQM